MKCIQDVLDTNALHSQIFVRQKALREAHRQQHPTGIMVTGCMDDRVNFSVITEMPFGIVKEFRTAGGKFNLCAPRFQEGIQNWSASEKGKGRNRLGIITDHKSKSHRELGCKGFGYDEKEARAASCALRKAFDYVYANEPGFYALNCTIETDEGALVFLGKKGQELDLANMDNASAEDLMRGLGATYPDMPHHMAFDLLPFLENNLTHIKKTRALGRLAKDMGHNASVVAVGTGTDWILSGAYVISPADPNFSDAFKTALELVGEDYKKSRRKSILLASASFQPPSCFADPAERDRYSEEGFCGRRLAELKARGLMEELLSIVRTSAPDRLQFINCLTTVVNLDTRLATPIE